MLDKCEQSFLTWNELISGVPQHKKFTRNLAPMAKSKIQNDRHHVWFNIEMGTTLELSKLETQMRFLLILDSHSCHDIFEVKVML